MTDMEARDKTPRPIDCLRDGTATVPDHAFAGGRRGIIISLSADLYREERPWTRENISNQEAEQQFHHYEICLCTPTGHQI